MSQSVDVIDDKNFWIVEEKEDEKIKRSDYDIVKNMEKRITVILFLGSTILDFANQHFCLNLHSTHKHGAKALKACFKIFFYKPKPAHRSISLEIKTKILKIPKIGSIKEVIDRLSKMYASYCFFVNDEDYEDYIKRRDKNSLELLLKKAPCAQNYDEQLYDILADYITEW